VGKRKRGSKKKSCRQGLQKGSYTRSRGKKKRDINRERNERPMSRSAITNYISGPTGVREKSRCRGKEDHQSTPTSGWLRTYLPRRLRGLPIGKGQVQRKWAKVTRLFLPKRDMTQKSRQREEGKTRWVQTAVKLSDLPKPKEGEAGKGVQGIEKHNNGGEGRERERKSKNNRCSAVLERRVS